MSRLVQQSLAILLGPECRVNDSGAGRSLPRAIPTATAQPSLQDTRYVTQAELAEMMDPASGLRWSPWFRIIATHFLPGWWHGLEAACSGSGGHQDLASIHRLG